MSRYLDAESRSMPAEPAGLAVCRHLPEYPSGPPLVFQPAVDDIDTPSWIRSNLEELESRLVENGAILLRSFPVKDAASFDAAARAFCPCLMDYNDQHTPRTRVTPDIYTSTEYPSDHRIPFHSENSKNLEWPLKLWFFCLQPPSDGGETLLADNQKVLAKITPSVSRLFAEKGVMYVRNFGEGLGLSWQTAFQTEDQWEVERRCGKFGMEFEWRSGGRLRTRHTTPALAVHPATHQQVWFNQAHLFHVTSAGRQMAESLLDLFCEEDLPSNAYFGDGTRMEPAIIEEIRNCFEECAISFRWQAGDVLMLDNMLMAHARNPFVGQRRVLVAMAEPCNHDGPLQRASHQVRSLL